MDQSLQQVAPNTSELAGRLQALEMTVSAKHRELLEAVKGDVHTGAAST